MPAPAGTTSAGTPAENTVLTPEESVDLSTRPSHKKPMKVPWDVTSFKGDNVTAYLRRYNLLANDCGLQGRDKLNRFTAYCSDEIIAEVEAQEGYEAGHWETFEESLTEYYFDRDPQEIEYQMPFLRVLAERQRVKGAASLKSYATRFQRIVNELIKKHAISQYTACAEFFGGLPDEVQKDVQKNLGIKFSKHDTLNVGTMIREVISMEDMKLERVRMLHTTGGPVNTAIPSVFPMPTIDLTPSVPSTPSAVS